MILQLAALALLAFWMIRVRWPRSAKPTPVAA